jgi:uridylate kinase
MDSIGISLGGSILYRPSGFNRVFATKLAELIREEEDTRFAVVCGGGRLARASIASLRAAGVENKLVLDEAGTEATRLNALLLKSVFVHNGVDVAPVVPRSFDDFKREASKHRVVVSGGFIEGVTTDTDTLLAAEWMGAKLVINVSNISYVYDKDPAKYPDAVKKEHLTHEGLIKIVNSGDRRDPGSNVIFDRIASVFAQRSKIEIRFVGPKIDQLAKAIHRKEHGGTVVAD